MALPGEVYGGNLFVPWKSPFVADVCSSVLKRINEFLASTNCANL